ncbi:MAG TPA: hydrogenase [Cytophagales bacterium]|nr:hydrogenase [Cytophagales bacterium]
MEDKKRRDVLKMGAVAGLAAIAGAAKFLSPESEQPITECGDKVKLLSQDGEIIEVQASMLKLDTHDHAQTMARKVGREGIPGRKFVMVIDLGRCRNARKCVTACQKMHYLPEDKEWLQIKLMKDNEKSAPYWFPKTCFHCDNPPCVKVCPVDATFKRTDGLVLIDNERCIGCKFCMAACPYSTRVFNWGEPEITPGAENVTYSPETSVPSRHSTVEKCDFCPDMARQGKLPDCVTACPNGVFYFGDENEDSVSNGSETVRLSTLLRDKAAYRYMEELGTKPRVYYLPPSNRMFPVERGFKNLSEEIKERYKDVH